MRRGLSFLIGAAALLTLTLPARADGPLVRGGAPLPEFHLGLPILGLSGQELTPDLDMSVSRPGESALNFLFSPRVVSGKSLDLGTGTSKSVAGLSWNVFESDKLFGTLGVSGMVSHPGYDDPTRLTFGQPTSLHSTLELGYQLDPQNSLSFSLDHATPTFFGGERVDTGDNLRLRYGFHF